MSTRCLVRRSIRMLVVFHWYCFEVVGVVIYSSVLRMFHSCFQKVFIRFNILLGQQLVSVDDFRLIYSDCFAYITGHAIFVVGEMLQYQHIIAGIYTPKRVVTTDMFSYDDSLSLSMHLCVIIFCNLYSFIFELTLNDNLRKKTNN